LKYLVLIWLILFSNNSIAGTPGNSDISYIYSIAIIIIGTIWGIDTIKNHIKTRKEKLRELLNWEDDWNA
jgi:uncharacterized membrane protein YbhN (UPF0104 family)